MSASFKAAADVQKLANTFAVLQELADALKKLASLEQMDNEFQLKVDKHEKAVAADKDEIAKQRAAVAEIQATAKAQAESLLMQAEAERDLILAQAKAQAAQVLEEAQQTLDDATETKEEAYKKLTEAKEEAVQINKEVSALEQRANAAKDFLDRLTKS